MKLLPLITLLLVATPLSAQSRVYTNADLTAHPVTQWTRTATVEDLASLKAREFHLPILPDGPTVIIVGQSPAPLRLLPYRPLQEPWSMSTYVGRSGGGRSSGRTRTTHTVAPGITLRYP